SPWKQSSSQRIYYIDASFLKQVSTKIHLKGGIAGEFYNLRLDSDRYIAQPQSGDEALFNFSLFSNHFHRTPRYIAGFGEVRLDYPFIRVQLGSRVDYFTASTLGLNRPLQDSTYVRNRQPGKYMFSPRISLSVPFSDHHQVMLNYGRFVQIAPMFYFYAGSGTSAENAPLWPLYGNVDLNPLFSESSEISYVYSVSDATSLSLTGFWRTYSDIIDTRNQAFHGQGGSAQTTPTLYQNQASSRARGIELEANYAASAKTQFRLTYTYMQATGTTNKPEDRYFQFVSQGVMPALLERPLNWDQRHSFILESHITPARNFYAAIVWRLYSSRKWLNTTLTEQQFKKIPWRNFLDLKLNYRLHSKYFTFLPFFEVRNVFNIHTQEDEERFFLIDNQPLRPFEDRLGRRFRLGIQIN
ncbi:MAG: hypothetical protein D6814_17735, partial [Calditrichaeota bacterium]